MQRRTQSARGDFIHTYRKKKHSLVFWEHTSSVAPFLVVIPITTLQYLFVKSKQRAQQDEARGQERVRAAAAAERLAGSSAGPRGFTRALLVRLGGLGRPRCRRASYASAAGGRGSSEQLGPCSSEAPSPARQAALHHAAPPRPNLRLR